MENYEDIDIKRILEIIFSKKILIILILLLSITLGYVYSYYYKKPEYKSSVTILLVADENRVDKELTQTDLSINSSLISTYSSIAKSTNVIQKTIENLGLNISASKLQKSIEATQIEKTQFLKITVKNENPEVAKNIANELAKVFTEQIKEIYNLENISIVDEAEVESQPCNINHIKDIIIFTFAGMIVSAILVMVIYIFDDTIKDEKDIERNIKLKNIGTLPVDKENNELIIENNPKSHIVECIKTLRTNILYTTNKKSILITSSRQKEGKSWVSNNLAVALAQADKKVILVDTDLRKENNRNEIFNVEKGEGLSDFIKEISDDKLENLEKSKKYIKETQIPNLHILQNGTLPPNPAELITSENMKRLLNLLKSMYDIVLLDGTPCMVVSDSIALSSMVDSTILVTESKKTKINDLKKTKKLIEEVNGKILGVITNKSEIQKGKYYGKRYGYYYGSELKESEKTEKIEEKQKPVSLDEIIEMAKENIKYDLLNEEETIQENNEIDQKNQQTNSEIKSIKNEIINEIKKLKNAFVELKKDNTKQQINNINNDINNLKETQNINNKQLVEKMENINNELKNSKEEYSKALEDINDKLISNREEYTQTIEEIKEKDNENLTAIIQQFISEVNVLRNEIKQLKDDQANNNTELLERLEKVNYEEKLAEINEKIENMNNEEKTSEVKNTNNIISFESLKEKRKLNKKVFKTDEEISFDDLQRLSTCIIDLNEDLTSIKEMSN